jgi:hypothetical protein
MRQTAIEARILIKHGRTGFKDKLGILNKKRKHKESPALFQN